ncbi:MAG: AAA family ATPase [Chlamydiales bacterium]|nr:AAA family ATPase [Chlamydiales bacterium]
MQQLQRFLGNQAAQKHLAKLLASDAVPSVLLFSGPEGVGKSTIAKTFAKTLLKSSRLDHPDLRILEPEGKTNLHPIDNIRALIDSFALPPYEANRKIFIIADCDRMYTYAANALLKILEEPPSYGLLILTSSNSDKLLPTILSRCSVVPFQPLSKLDILAFLSARTDRTDLDKLAILSQGSLSRAEKLLEGTLDPKPIIDFITHRTPLDGEPEELLPLLHYWYRDLHLLKAGGSTQHLFFKDHIDLLQCQLQKPLPSLEELHIRLADALEASQRGIKLKTTSALFP